MLEPLIQIWKVMAEGAGGCETMGQGEGGEWGSERDQRREWSPDLREWEPQFNERKT